MSGSYLFLAEMAITLFAVVGWGLWELHQLKKFKKDDVTPSSASEKATSSAPQD